MKKAYVILAHKNPDQLYKLIKALDDGASLFFIHIDKRCDIAGFDSLTEFNDKVQLLPRVKTEWGSFALVQAVLNGLEAVKRSSQNISAVILLSGQDYPIKSNGLIDGAMGGQKIYLEYFGLPNAIKWQPNGGLYRVNKYFMGLKPHQRYAAKTVNLMARFLPFLRRRLYKEMKAVAGSMWWIINRYAVDYILDFIAQNPGYIRFHRYTFAPDELFFHMILVNAKDERIASALVNDDKRFIRWKNIQAAHPETISKKNMADLMSSDALFARKFDITEDAEVFDLIDAHRTS